MKPGRKVAYVGIGNDFEKLWQEGMLNDDNSGYFFDNYGSGVYKNKSINRLSNLMVSNAEVIFITSSPAYTLLKQEVLSLVNDYGIKCIVV